MADKKQASVKQTAIHEIRVSDVVIQIHRRRSNSGYSYLDFSLHREHTTSTGHQSRSATFFAENGEHLAQAIRNACAWIRERPQGDAQDQSPADVQ